MHINTQTNLTDSKEKRGVVIPFHPSVKSSDRSKPCIFCGGIVALEIFKEQTVCIGCLQHIQTLFLSKRVELL